jgi:putative copper export protein
MTTLVFLHILGAVIWAGGLVFVGLVAAGARRTVPARERAELFRFVGRGLLVMGVVAAVLLGLSGNFLVDDRFGGLDDLSGEPGRLILWKTILFAGVLALAFVHGLVLGPGIRRLRLSQAEGQLTDAEEALLRRKATISGIAQVAMLTGTVAILALAADLVA